MTKLVHNCAGYDVQMVLAEVSLDGDSKPGRAVHLMGTRAHRRQQFDRLYDRVLLNEYDPPSFALKLGYKDMRLARSSAASWACRCGLPIWRSLKWRRRSTEVGGAATADHPRCASSNAVASTSKLILDAFKGCSTAIRCTMVVQSAGKRTCRPPCVSLA